MSIPINDTLAPRTGGYALIDDGDVGGSLHVVADIAARDLIQSENLKVGMLAYTQADGKYWKLTSLLPVWVEFLSGGGVGTVTSVATGTGLTGGPITSTGTISLANTAVSANSYTKANITVDAQGRLTAAANGTPDTLAVAYAIGTAAADQTLLIQAGDGGPLICKANGAATGALLKVQTSGSADLINFNDDSTQLIKSNMADGASAIAFKVDTSTAWVNAGAKLLSILNNNVEKAYVLANGDIVSNGVNGFRTSPSTGYLNTTASMGIVVDIASAAAAVFGGNFIPYSDAAALNGDSGHRWSETWSTTFKNSSVVSLLTTLADGAASVAASIDTSTAWVNATAKLLSIKNNNVEKFNVMASGVVNFSTYATTPSGGSGGLFNVANTKGLLIDDNGTSIVTYGGGIAPFSDNVFDSGDSSFRWSENWAVRYAGKTQNVTPSATPTFDITNGGHQRIILTADITSWAITAGREAEIVTLSFIQDNVGGWTLAGTPGNVLLAGGTFVLTAGANKRDQITFRYDSFDSLWVEQSRAQNL